MKRGTHRAHGKRSGGLFALLLALVIGLLTGWYVADEVGGGSPVATAGQRQPGASGLQEELDLALGELEVLRTLREVDRQALELVRSELALQNEHMAELEEGLRFYRSLSAPEGVGGGLSLREAELMATEDAERYVLRVVVQQVARKHEKVEGSVSIAIAGTHGGERVSYALEEISKDLDTDALALQFRYFQSIEGDIILPEGFEPESIHVTAQADKPRSMTTQRDFPWHLQERFTHVGQ